MKITKRNHYNPCFWTALWNSEYYDNFISGEHMNLQARVQVVNTLNVKADKIFSTSVNNVHYEKNIGKAEISKEAALDFVLRHHPDKYDSFNSKCSSEDYPVFLDFEDILTKIEEMPLYKVLMDVAKKGGISTAEEKSFLGCFVVIQLYRSHAVMNSMLELHQTMGLKKFEHFVTLKWLLGDARLLFSSVYPIVACKWKFYKVKSNMFPLCDSPILVKPHSIMVALSPRLLLEIITKIPATEDEWNIKHSISEKKLSEFRQRTIGNTFRDIIFSDNQLLQRWKQSSEFRERVFLMKESIRYNQLIQTERNKELWIINAFGNKN